MHIPKNLTLKGILISKSCKKIRNDTFSLGHVQKHKKGQPQLTNILPVPKAARVW
jgi:hypothetical protein